MITTNQFNALAIGQYTQVLNHADQKGKSSLCQAIALLSHIYNEDTFNLYQISKALTKAVKTNIEFCTSIKKRFLLFVSSKASTEKALYKWKPINRLLMLNRKVRTKFAPKTYFLMRTNSIFRHIRDEFSDTLEKGNYLTSLLNYVRSNDRQSISSSRLQVDSCIRPYTNKPIRVAMIKRVSMKNIFFINYLSNLILHAVLTQPAKDSLSFLACSRIWFSKSSSNLIVFIELFGRSYFKFFAFLSCIGYLTSMPRDCNSFRITLFIQPASDSSPSSFCAFSMARRNWLSNRIWKGVLVDFLLLSLLCIDIVIILNYYNLHVITLYVKSNCKTMPRSATNTIEASNQTIKIEVMIMANRYDNAHLCARQSKTTNHKKDLPNDFNMGYINSTLAKSKGRIGTLFSLLATHDALSVFFCVNACVHPLKQFSSMVALAGHPKGWLVSSRASSSNPVNVTAQEIGTSRGDYNNHLLEDATMATAPTTLLSNQKLYKFYDLSTAQVVQTTATTDRQARHNLGKQSLIFIARKPLTPTFECSINWGGYSHV